MAQSGFTPILLYASGTPSAAPSAGNLTSSASGAELALNYADGKLFYKDSGGVVQTLATKATGTIGGSTTQVQYNNAGALAGSANLTFNGTTLTANALSLTNSLTVANGGTGLTSGTSGGIPYFSSTSAMTSSALLAANALMVGGGAGAAPATITTGTGVVTALGNATNATGGFATVNGTATLTNKRVDPRVSSAASASSLTPDISSFDQYAYTALAVDLTINAPIGTPVDGNKLVFRLLDNGTTRTLTWNATYTAIGVTLPTATTANKTTYVGCIYNANNTRWDVIAVVTQA